MRISTLALIFVIVIVMFSNWILKDKKNEYFVVSNIRFLGKSKAFQVLKQLDYFNNFNYLDYKLRNCNKNNVLDVYRKSIQEFTQEEKQALRWLVKYLDDKIQKILPNEWCFIKTLNIEAGMPHTRGNCIVLPVSFINETVEYKRNSKIPEHLGLTLIHEQVHIYQRQNPEIFEDLYVNYWQFTHPKNIYAINRNRTNPDGTDIKWLYRGELLPISIYKANAKTIKDVDNVLFNGVNYKSIKNSSYERFFGSKNNYHPNEIAAFYFEEYFSKSNKNPLAYKQFKRWLNT